MPNKIQTQRQKQMIQEAEKKVKKMKKLENVLLGGAVLGLGAGITGMFLDNESLGVALSMIGLGGGASSAIAGFYTVLNRQVLEGFLKYYKKNNEYQIELENEYKAGLEDNQRWTIK